MFLIATRRLEATRVSQSFLFVCVGTRLQTSRSALTQYPPRAKVYMPAGLCKHIASLSVNNNIPHSNDDINHRHAHAALERVNRHIRA